MTVFALTATYLHPRGGEICRDEELRTRVVALGSSFRSLLSTQAR